MHITFIGAAGEVTGSCSLLEKGPAKLLIDCGMFQGSDFNEGKNSDPFPFEASELSAVFVTHAHLDHVGRLPVLVKNGYSGYFYATAPTIDLTRLTLEDAASIMFYDHKKFSRPILYDDEDIRRVMAQFKVVEYDKPIKPLGAAGDMTVTFRDAGHIFGSSFIEFEAEGKRAVFSGDVGNVNVPILRDTEDLPKSIDALVCESTYGDRQHESTDARQKIIEDMISSAISRGGVLMIPSFSIERTQELIYELNDLIEHKHKLTNVPIFLDSPMAIDALKVFRKYPKFYDEGAEQLLASGDDMFDFPNLKTTYTREESMKINHTPGTKIIIAGSGMMNGGRILHHAIRYLSDEKSTLLIIGYQAHGTLGRQLQEGKKVVTVMGEQVRVACQIKTIGALSAHGDQDKIVSWIRAAQPKRVFLNHGEKTSSTSLAERIKEEARVEAIVVTKDFKVEV